MMTPQGLQKQIEQEIESRAQQKRIIEAQIESLKAASEALGKNPCLVNALEILFNLKKADPLR